MPHPQLSSHGRLGKLKNILYFTYTASQPLTRLFISYSSKDLQLAEEIDACLKSEGFDVWRDKRKIETDWSKEIAEALAKSDIILVVWTKTS
jgi:hypothetical protein